MSMKDSLDQNEFCHRYQKKSVAARLMRLCYRSYKRCCGGACPGAPPFLNVFFYKKQHGGAAPPPPPQQRL